MDKLEKLKKEREELDKRIETLEYAERIFEEGEKVYYVDQFGNVNCVKWNNSVWIDGAFIQGHIFRTKQAAGLEAKRRNLLTRFIAFRDECNGYWKINWNDGEQEKYIIKCDKKRDLYVVTYFTINEFNIFGYFKDDKDAKRAIELFGDEIKKLFVDCECD